MRAGDGQVNPLAFGGKDPISPAMAKLYFYYASMNAGKSTTLLQANFNYHERGMTTMLWTAALDDRGGERAIESRIGLHADAHRFDAATDLWERIGAAHRVEPLACVLVDEAQFLTSEQVRQLHRMAHREDVPVICFGLRSDFRGEAFPGAAALLTLADDLEEMKTICACARKASMNLRIDAAGALVNTDTGTLSARQQVQLAGELRNGGAIDAGGRLQASAREEIVNTGSMVGAEVDLAAGQHLANVGPRALIGATDEAGTLILRATVIENLKQHVENFRVRLLNFVKQDRKSVV